jgi:hypothetical protein
MRAIRNTMRLAAGFATLLPALAGAQLVSSGAVPDAGGGLGSVPTVLTLNNTNDVSSGCVSPIANFAGCGFVNNTVQNQSTTRLLSEVGGSFASLGTDLRIIANFSEPGGNSATVNNLVLSLYNGTSSIFSAALAAPVTFGATNPGVGNAGFGFSLAGSSLTDFQALVNSFGNTAGSLRLGLGASLSDVQGGLDTFSVGRVASGNPGGPGSVVPEPSTYILLGTGLLSLGGIAARRRRQS